MTAMSRNTLVSSDQITRTGCLFASVLTSASTIAPPAPPLREVDRERVEGDDGDQEQRAQRFEDLHRRLGGAELARLHDHELAGVRIGVCLQLVLQPEPCRQPHDRRSQVQCDLSVRGRDVPVLAQILALQHTQNSRVGALVGVLPKRLHPRPLQQPVGGRGHDGVLERGRQYGGSSLSLRRQPLAQLGFYVDSLEECVAELLRDRAPNLVVCQQLRRRVCPRIVVEQLTLRPDRERRNKQQDRRQREQDPDKHSALLAHPRTTAQTSGLDVLKDLLFLSVELAPCVSTPLSSGPLSLVLLGSIRMVSRVRKSGAVEADGPHPIRVM